MKSDLDRILLENNLDGMLVCGPGVHNPAMVYLTGGGQFSNADLLIKRDGRRVLFHHAMERDEVARSGLETCSYDLYPIRELLKEVGNDRFRARVLRYARMLQDVGLSSGRIALFGRGDIGIGYSLFSALQETLPDLVLVGDLDGLILEQAMLTKDESEVERIRTVGKLTTEVVANVMELLSSTRIREDMLIGSDGLPLTIGAVKGKINTWLVERGLETPEGTIFSIGRDAGVPHSSGNPGDILQPGRTIIFDIYPCEAGGGYFHDLTRTWSVGFATDEAQSLYEQVANTYKMVYAQLKSGVRFSTYQQRTCEIFEAMGHPSVLNQAHTQAGYVHSLGHGVGLNIHERPFSAMTALETDVLQPGTVFTLEPGLYYPDRGMGVRLENTLYVRPDGVIETLVEPPMDFIIPVKG